MAGTFGDRIDALKAMVGTGDLTGKVEVSQIYARAQHENLNWAHPRGGQALYLSQPLLENHPRYLQAYAGRLLEDGGEASLAESMENLAEEGGVATRAPVLYANLRASGAPSVTSGGVTVYSRPPRQHRLSEEELKALYRVHHPVPERGSRKPWNRGV